MSAIKWFGVSVLSGLLVLALLLSGGSDLDNTKTGHGQGKAVVAKQQNLSIALAAKSVEY